MWVSVFVVLFGAEINAEAERQTRQDTTAGAPLPVSKGGTKAADVVPHVRHRRR
jgi:membrane protein